MNQIRYDGPVTIAVGESRRSTQWKNKEVLWSQLVERLSIPTKTPETVDEYRGFAKSKRDEIKDVGGFVGGSLKGGRRKAEAIMQRRLLTLDLDDVPRNADPWDTVVLVLGCAAVLYSTHSHRPEAPRLRLVMPLSRPVSPVTKIVGQKGYILCLACETDFVAQNAEYSASANAMLDVAVKTDAADRDALLAAKNAEGRTVEEMVTEKSGQTGEKIELAYYARIEAPYCHAYVHFNKKLGTLIGFNKVVPEEVAHTVAMQATAMAPVSISEADCPADVIEHERKIAVEAMKQDPKNANKPEAILEKIAEGKMRKFFEENTLLNQPVVGEKETIAEFIHKADKDATVIAYKRFALEA